jgi:hypothetical protein
VGRRGAHGHGARRRQAARLLRQLRASRQRRRRLDVHRHVSADAAAAGGRLRVVGLARAVSREHRARARGSLHSPANHGVAGVREDEGEPPSREGARLRAAAQRHSQRAACDSPTPRALTVWSGTRT